jgi:glycosyltransferase involved in cell wall biosynthesis
VVNELFYVWQCPKKTDILWINDHTKYFLLEKTKYQKSIYDITDDWTLIDPHAALLDRFLCQAVDQVLVCSQGLLKSRRQFSENIVLVKNGINLQDYHFQKGRGKYFLYTGSLHEDRVDVALMLRLAKEFPQEQFMYVGPVFMRQQTVAKLWTVSNIMLTGAQPYNKMAAYMNQAKALIVPHRQTPFVNSLDPIKQYEYMLSEVPVITTKVSGFNDWPRLFTVVTPAQFCTAIRLALRGKIIVNRVARRRAARGCTWNARYTMVKGILCSKK